MHISYIKIILAVLLFLCLLDMPYDYYQLVRFLAMLAFAYLAYFASQKRNTNAVFIYIGLAILFQPLVKIALGRTIWNGIDVIVGLGLLLSLMPSKTTPKQVEHNNPNNSRITDDAVTPLENITLKVEPVVKEIITVREVIVVNEKGTLNEDLAENETITGKKIKKPSKIKQDNETKNKWLYPTDDLGKLEKGVELDSITYLRENPDKNPNDFTII
ncbi:DUF6804 family protein [Flavobacterium sp.]|jgi:hypothetical protein|uniref:DUF6804 family protein n=1 Tax=Flavobacterium sp. TaxID=239 RepID=UPI0037C16A1F